MASTETTIDEQKRIKRVNDLFDNVQALFPNVEYLTYEKYNDIMSEQSSDASSVLVVDVREREEMQTATLEHAINLKDLNERLKKVPDKTEQKIVCFCTVGVRSGIQAERLRQQGCTQIWNYSVMVHAWGNVNNNSIDNAFVQQGNKKWDGHIHVYAKKYENLMPPSLKTKYFTNWSALTKGLPSLPGILSAFGSSGRWKK